MYCDCLSCRRFAGSARDVEAGQRRHVEDRVGVDCVLAVERVGIAGFTERSDAERVGPVSGDRAEP